MRSLQLGLLGTTIILYCAAFTPAQDHSQVACPRSAAGSEVPQPKDLRRRRDLLHPLLTCAPRSDRLSALSVAEMTQDRSPGVIPAAFCAQSPNLRFASLMDCGLRSTSPARPTLTPYIRFLFIDSHICLTLPSDLASRR
jgi:hypothetical protein